MALGDIATFTVEVETATPGTFIAINEMTGYSGSKTRDVRTTRVFMRTVPRRLVLSPDRTISLSGILDTTDPGQMRLRAQEQAGLPVNIRVQPIGPWDDDAGGPNPVRPNGFTVSCLVNSFRHEASADGDYQTNAFELTPIADPVVVASGPVLI